MPATFEIQMTAMVRNIRKRKLDEEQSSGDDDEEKKEIRQASVRVQSAFML